MIRPLVLTQTRYQLHAGEARKIDGPRETVDFVRNAKSRSIRIGGQEAKGFVVGPGVRGDEVLLAASLTMKPGEYALTFSAVSELGEQRVTTLAITLEPMQAVPLDTARPPVILLNGWQLCPISVTSPPSAGTFGSLENQLVSTAPVYFFDNCQYGDVSVELLAHDLGQVISSLQYTDGTPVAQVDIVAHSMGGLIARGYLAGIQSNETFLPPANPKVRKLVLIATPNFGSFQAPNVGIQTPEMVPGSAFLWNLARWNQRGDDLRGVDALAIIGNAGYAPLSGIPPQYASDGVVSLTSGSLGFASTDPSRTRIVSYCHTDPGFEASFGMSCSGAGGIANVTDEFQQTGQIVRSFLADTSAWTLIGSTPSQDPYLSQFGGIYFALENAAGQYLHDLNQVQWGTVGLQDGGATHAIYYNEFVRGMATFQVASASLGTVNCGPFTEPVGYYTTFRCKYAPLISSVTPPLAGASGRVVQSGTTITLNGSGFGQACSGCQVLAVPAGSSLGYPLQISSWSDQTITAFLPGTYSGFVQLFVQTASGSDEINIMTAPSPAAPAIAVTSQSLQFAYTIGGTAPVGQSIQITNSGGGTLSWNVAWSAPWLSVTPSSGTAPSSVSASVLPTGLAAGTYSDTIQITSAGASNSPLTISVTLTVAPAAPSSTVSVSAVVNGASFQPGIASSTWITIFGTNLSQTTRHWTNSDFVGGNLPTQLDGVAAKVNGIPAYVYYVSPTQLNVLAPDDTTVGQVQVQVTTAQGTSNAFAADKRQIAPAFFLVQGTKYVAATHPDGTHVGKPGLIAGGTFVPAKPGDIISLWGTGFGPTNPSLPAAKLVTNAASLANPVTMMIGSQQAKVSFAGRSGSGLDQFNVTVPATLPDGDQTLVASIGGLQTQAGIFITVQK